ncbi:hypothetical protein APA_45 [Pseudanabaena sp. lw0831]|nr:hypothetical protein APA_45 [Pseudanabaena sp. lw0831]
MLLADKSKQDTAINRGDTLQTFYLSETKFLWRGEAAPQKFGSLFSASF